MLADPSIWDQDKAPMYVLGWRSTMIRRVCRSTFAAETQAMISAVGEGEKIRAAMADMTSTTVNPIRHLWLTDCESLYSYLTNPVNNGTEDKRLEIDLEDLRQMLWEDPSGRPKDDLSEQQVDKIRWIDTSTMLADPLTKLMKSDRLMESLDKSYLDLTPTRASTLAKVMKRKQRSKSKTDDNFLDDVDIMYDPSYGEDYMQSKVDEMDLTVSQDLSTYCATTDLVTCIPYTTMSTDDMITNTIGLFQ